MAQRADSAAPGAASIGIGRNDAERGLTSPQWLSLCITASALGALGGAGWLAAMFPAGLSTVMVLVAGWRLLSIILSPTTQAPGPLAEGVVLPTYTIILALYDEAEILPQLKAAIDGLQYPPHLVQLIAAVEAHDAATIAACRRALPRVEIVTAQGRGPQTKPRALNSALRQATGDLVVVYDAEDQPHPNQLLEAADRFVRSGPDLAVLQAPLLITLNPRSRWIQRQFAVDYAAHFLVTLPAMTRLGLPFPLGGTSNHFRRSALLAVHGWDAWNVTEDADIGFRLARAGYRADMLTCPTIESAPDEIGAWIKQRGRWIKGHLQTVGVMTRRPLRLGWRSGVALIFTLVVGVLAAALHAPLIAYMLLQVLSACCGQTVLFRSDGLSLASLMAYSSTELALCLGARRAGASGSSLSLLTAPLYWPLQSLAFLRAVQQLAYRPFHWDKTTHVPSVAPETADATDPHWTQAA